MRHVTDGARRNQSGIVNLDNGRGLVLTGPDTHLVAYAKRNNRICTLIVSIIFDRPKGTDVIFRERRR